MHGYVCPPRSSQRSNDPPLVRVIAFPTTNLTLRPRDGRGFVPSRCLQHLLLRSGEQRLHGNASRLEPTLHTYAWKVFRSLVLYVRMHQTASEHGCLFRSISTFAMMNWISYGHGISACYPGVPRRMYCTMTCIRKSQQIATWILI
jgi:hypothetical protein